MKGKTTRGAPTVFYAWQSDLPSETNRYFIRAALEGAIKRLGTTDVELGPLQLDETTRNTPGAPVIVDVILGKIDRCEVFVGDVSVINPDAASERHVPNPNVIFEVGWAAGRVGWDRTILIFNEATGTLESDVPFDLRGRRILLYSLPANSARADIAKVSKHVQQTLVTALKASLASPPPLRRSLAATRVHALSAEQQRERDSAVLLGVLTAIDSVWIDRFLVTLENQRILPDGDEHYFQFQAVITSATFRFFDRTTAKAVSAFSAAWDRLYELMQYGDAYAGEAYVRFRPESFVKTAAEAHQLRNDLHDATVQMTAAWKGMLARIHRAFPEFDLRKTDLVTRGRINAHRPTLDA